MQHIAFSHSFSSCVQEQAIKYENLFSFCLTTYLIRCFDRTDIFLCSWNWNVHKSKSVKTARKTITENARQDICFAFCIWKQFIVQSYQFRKNNKVHFAYKFWFVWSDLGITFSVFCRPLCKILTQMPERYYDHLWLESLIRLPI